jgi:hypothetical protein
MVRGDVGRVQSLVSLGIDPTAFCIHWEIDYRKIIEMYRNFDGKLLHSYDR